MKVGFRAYARILLCDMNHRQMRAYALYGISQKSMELIYRFIAAIFKAKVQSLVKGL